MMNQSQITNYFNANKPNKMQRKDEKKKIKRSLSLIKPVSPQKLLKVEEQVLTNTDIIYLSSDEEATNISGVQNSSLSSIEVDPLSSESSHSTVIYSVTPETPQKTPQKSADVFRSPSSKEKYYSPTKKRTVRKRTPKKRNLTAEFGNYVNANSEDIQFQKACENMSDKTVFLLTIINKYLHDDCIRNLLDEDSQSLLQKSFHVVKPGMGLVCRFYWRKEGWYKKDKIKTIITEMKNTENLCLQLMLNSLVENDFIDSSLLGNNNMIFEDYAAILNVDEVKQICKDLKLKTQSKRNSIEALREFAKTKSNIVSYFTGNTRSNSQRVLHMMKAKAGPCYRLSDLARRTLYRLHVLMYLGMNYNILREHKLELTLINDKIRVETYPVDKDMILDNASVVFESILDFERYMNAHSIYEYFLGLTDTNLKCDTVKEAFTLYKAIDEKEMRRDKTLPEWLRRFTQANIFVKILETGIQDLKKDKYCSLALEILTTLISQSAFRQHKKAEWYAEKALILHSLRSYDEAAEVLLEGFKSDLPEEAKDSMRPRARKIATQKNIVLDEHLRSSLLEHATKDTTLEANLPAHYISKLPMDKNGRGKVKFETRTEEGRVIQDAEEFCVSHYISSGQFTHGQHWEGKIITTIFFLLFWDIIYTKPRGVRGIFLSYYQSYPLDLFTDSFYANRKAIIDDWLDKIKESSQDAVISIMENIWNSRPESELSGITRSLEWENVRTIASCLGPRALSALCRRLATNYRYAHSGFPDLTLWHIHTKKIKFVEVKTDTDIPSMKQIQWMHYLREHGIDTEFCYVGMHSVRRKSRAQNLGTNDPEFSYNPTIGY